MKFIFTFIFLFFIAENSFSQKLAAVKKLSSEYQNCLDKGYGMTGCAGSFLYQMDSLLNVYYNDIRKKCTNIQKANLKKEQLLWLKKRDKQFTKNKKAAEAEAKKEGFSDYVEQMFEYNKNAEIVKKRVIALAKATPSNYSIKKK